MYRGPVFAAAAQGLCPTRGPFAGCHPPSPSSHFLSYPKLSVFYLFKPKKAKTKEDYTLHFKLHTYLFWLLTCYNKYRI